MNEEKFSKWYKWTNRDKYPETLFPGVYIISYSKKDISEKPLTCSENIIYIGMTNSKGGIKQRLKQFDNTISGKKGHGGADRVRFKFPTYEELVPNLYVSIFTLKVNANETTAEPKDFIKMGCIASLEFEAFAWFKERHKRLPEFNDKKKSKKYSLENRK